MHALRMSRRHRGIVYIWVAVIGLVMCSFIGLSIDLGYSYLVGGQMQNAADASAMAGAWKLLDSDLDVRSAATTIALSNSADGRAVKLDGNQDNGDAGDIIVGRYDRSQRQFMPTLTNPNAVKVNVRYTDGSLNGPSNLFFGKLFGVSSVSINRSAVAMIDTDWVGDAGLLVLNETDPRALDINGDVTLRVDGGSIQVNSSDSRAMYVVGNSVQLQSEGIDVVGDYRWNHSTTDVNDDADVITDPLASMPAPPIPAIDNGKIDINTGSVTVTVDKGYYSGGIEVSGYATINFEPGIYVLGGVGLNASGNAVINAPGCMFYLIDSAAINLSGNYSMSMTGPDASKYNYGSLDISPWEGVNFFQARDNTAEAKIVGNTGTNIEGVIYTPSAHLDLSGTAGLLGSTVIADTVELSGTVNIRINHDDSENPPIVKSVYLVE